MLKEYVRAAEISHRDLYYEPCSTRCACGETKGLEAFVETPLVIRRIARIAICDGCGDDSAFSDDAIENLYDAFA